MAEDNDKLAAMLDDGWSVAGYSTAMMAAGGMVHSILLSKGNALATATLFLMGETLSARHVVQLSPANLPVKKGWF